MDFLKFDIANVIVSIQSIGIRYPEGPSPFYTPFRSQKKTDIQITIKKKPLPKQLSKEQLIFDCSPSWKLYDTGNNYRMDIWSYATNQRDRIAFISKDFKKIDICVKKATWNFQALLRPLLEIIMVNYLAPRKGLLLHAAAIRDGNRGYTYIGKSGAGKTTTTQLWKNKEGDYSILGDERTIIRKVNDQWKVYGTPWPGIGMITENKQVPLTHIFCISHGLKSHEIIKPHPIILFQDIFGQVFNSFWNEDVLSQLSETIHEMINEVPCYQFSFLKDESATDFVQEFVQNKLSSQSEASWKVSATPSLASTS